jgi:hypothetical protein
VWYHRRNWMKSTERTIWTPSVRAWVAAGIIVCLCFSAGEGLRLTPLPSLSPEEVRTESLRDDATLAGEATQSLSGPLDLPAPAQHRSKRQTPEYESPPASAHGEIHPSPLQPASVGSLAAIAPRLSDASPPGRAPPFTP